MPSGSRAPPERPGHGLESNLVRIGASVGTMSRRHLIAAVTLLAALGVLFALSQRRCVVAESVVIEAPCEDAWTYIGNSSNARQWSVFFSHITPLAGTPPDGTVGAVRRCFRRPDEAGITWDEELVEVVPLERRTIHVFNLRGFRAPRAVGTEFVTTQTYERLDPRQTRVTFSCWLDRPKDAIQRVIFWKSHWETARIFRVNLENIKAAVEHRTPPHTWEAKSVFD
jgi:Polyketide cyclase / dehydrase and lipid transport